MVNLFSRVQRTQGDFLGHWPNNKNFLLQFTAYLIKKIVQKNHKIITKQMTLQISPYPSFTAATSSSTFPPSISQQFSVQAIDFNLILAQSAMQSITCLGGMLGAFASVLLVFKLSRRESLLWINLFSVLVCLTSVYPNYKMFIVVRFLQGMVGGMSHNLVPMIIQEISPIEMATLIGALSNLSFFLGYFLTYSFGQLLNFMSGDRLLMIVKANNSQNSDLKPKSLLQLSAAQNNLLYPILKNQLPNQGFIYICYGTVALLFIPVIHRLMIEMQGKLDIKIAEEYQILDG